MQLFRIYTARRLTAHPELMYMAGTVQGRPPEYNVGVTAVRVQPMLSVCVISVAADHYT